MPQCDPTFAFSEIFWLFCTWGIVFLCLKFYAWPRMLERQEKQRAEHQKWIDAAIQRRVEIAEWQAAYQQALDVAHSTGRAHVHKELAIFEKDAEKRRHAFLNKHHTQPVSEAHDMSDVKEALSQWKQACLKILPSLSH